MRSIDEEDYGGATAAAGTMTQVVKVILTRYRWISTLRSSPDAPPRDKIFFSFSVPTSLLPDQPTAPDVDVNGDIRMEKAEQQDQEQKARVTAPAACAVAGCTYGQEKIWAHSGLGARGMRNGSLAHPGATVRIGISCGLRTVVEL